MGNCDRLVIGYDDSDDGAALAVGRKTGRGINFLKTIYGEEARSLYKALTENAGDVLVLGIDLASGPDVCVRNPHFSEVFQKIKNGEVPVCKEISEGLVKNPWLMEMMEARFNRVGEKPAFERVDFVMPKGLGLSEAKENFKRYMNEYWGQPVQPCELGMMTFEAFELSYKCKIFAVTNDYRVGDKGLEIRFDFENDRHMAFTVSERDLLELSPRRIQHLVCLQALELLYDKKETKNEPR